MNDEEFEKQYYASEKKRINSYKKKKKKKRESIRKDVWVIKGSGGLSENIDIINSKIKTLKAKEKKLNYELGNTETLTPLWNTLQNQYLAMKAKRRRVESSSYRVTDADRKIYRSKSEKNAPKKTSTYPLKVGDIVQIQSSEKEEGQITLISEHLVTIKYIVKKDSKKYIITKHFPKEKAVRMAKDFADPIRTALKRIRLKKSQKNKPTSEGFGKLDKTMDVHKLQKKGYDILTIAKKTGLNYNEVIRKLKTNVKPIRKK